MTSYSARMRRALQAVAEIKPGGPLPDLRVGDRVEVHCVEDQPPMRGTIKDLLPDNEIALVFPDSPEPLVGSFAPEWFEAIGDHHWTLTLPGARSKNSG
jgi:hypothetical protein